jgi:hypothetical protein
LRPRLPIDPPPPALLERLGTVFAYLVLLAVVGEGIVAVFLSIKAAVSP